MGSLVPSVQPRLRLSSLLNFEGMLTRILCECHQLERWTEQAVCVEETTIALKPSYATVAGAVVFLT